MAVGLVVVVTTMDSGERPQTKLWEVTVEIVAQEMGPVSQEQGYGEMEGMATEEHNLNVMVTTQANDPFVSGLDEPHMKNLFMSFAI